MALVPLKEEEFTSVEGALVDKILKFLSWKIYNIIKVEKNGITNFHVSIT